MKSIYKIFTIALIIILGSVAMRAQAEVTPLQLKMEKNREIRNNDLENKREPSGLMMKIEAERMIRASSTDMFRKTKDDRQTLLKRMQLRTFEIRKNALVKELTMVIKNLSNISTRVQSRITKAEESGRNMSNAKNLYTTALEKLAQAKTDLETFKTLSATSTIIVDPKNGTSTEMEVDLLKPRKLGDYAIKSVKEARDAMKKVVEAIARAMGEKTASSTEPTSI